MSIQSTAKAEAWARDLKERLVSRGFTVVQSTSGGYPKLTLNTDEASILIEQEDAVSKDVFGGSLLAYTPHKLSFASRADASSLTLKVAEIMIEVQKLGIKIILKSHATVLATAEASAGTVLEADVRWAGKGN